MRAADAAVSALHPQLSAKDISDQAILAIAYASRLHTEWFWAPLKKRLAETAHPQAVAKP